MSVHELPYHGRRRGRTATAAEHAASVRTLPSRIEIDIRGNLDALIERARRLQVFGPTVDFDAPVWDISSLKVPRPSAVSAQAGRLYFCTDENGTSKSMEGRTAWEPAFSGMMKAFTALSEHSKPKTTTQHRAVLRAVRPLYERLQDREGHPSQLTSEDFVEAARSFRVGYTQSTAYAMGGKLEQVAEFVNRHQLSKARISFSNPNPRVKDELKLIDEKARQEAMARKMPSDDAIDAIIGMSLKVREIGDDRDVLYAATTELLMCAAWRINELLNIAADSPRRETADGASRLGFAYGGSKGFEASIKWIPTNMVELAERAFADILRITEPSREVARFMEKHPGRAWLPEPWRLADRDTLITSNDIAGILGLSCAVVAVRWVKSKGIHPVTRKSTQGFYRIGDVEAAILKMQPKLPPGSPPLSSYLFLIPRWFTSDGDSMLPVVRFVSDGSFADFVVGRLEGRSIFERLDIRDPDGNAYAVRSHQIRHFLNNAAQEGRLSQLDIARWSGRKDVSQNAVYDHTGGMPLARTMRGLLKTEAMSGPIAETYSSLPPVEREGFLKSRLATAHLTEIGACIQDWSLAPCPKHGACGACGDHLVIKGDEKRKAAAERLLAEQEEMLAAAEAETLEGTYGASNWVEHNRKLVDGLRRIVAVHDNPSIPDGTPVQV